MQLQSTGVLLLDDHPVAARLGVALWREGRWRFVELRSTDQGFEAVEGGDRVTLRLTPTDDGYAYDLALSAGAPTRVRLGLAPVDLASPYHILPSVLFGDNNKALTPPEAFPTLTAGTEEYPNHAPYWEFRADRCACPASIVAFEGGVAAVSIEPYCDEPVGRVAEPAEEIGGIEPFVRNGVFAALPGAAGLASGEPSGSAPACGATLGYRNDPLTYNAKRNFSAPTMQMLAEGRSSGRVFLVGAADRLGVHKVVRALYDELRETPETKLDRATAIERLTTAMVTVGWSEEGGNCTDMMLDQEAWTLEPFRTNDEIAWTGGSQTAFPLLVAGHRAARSDVVEKAGLILDRIADPATINPSSGWLYDIAGDALGRNMDGWWSSQVGANHFAYTNGEAAAYLLRAFRFARDAMGLERPRWRATALKALDRAMAVQTPEGGFGYAYSPETGEVVDPDGFAGCWFVAALAEACALEEDDRRLEAAQRGIAFYDRFVRELNCWGTPMDTFKAVDQEGVLAFIRAARLLHELTHDAAYLAMLERGAEYEYLWRFAFRSRPQAPPLRGSSWNSCGGSITSTSNPHIHPMGVLVTGELLYLASQTDDLYHRDRAQDGLNWAVNCLGLYPEEVGYGEPGVLTERFCPSDGLLKERYPDGTPASVWWSYHPWGAANCLEGLLDAEA